MLYNLNNILKRYSRIPNWVPTPFNCQHGWTYLNHPLFGEIESKRRSLFLFSKRGKNTYDSVKFLKTYDIGPPFLYYKKLYNIKANPNRKGTIVYLPHNSKNVSQSYDTKKFLSSINSLPEKFKPITLSIYGEQNIEVIEKIRNSYPFRIHFTGENNDKNFCKFFYSELIKHKFSCSNKFGSYSIYSLELEIPFFIIGETPIHQNNIESGMEVGNWLYTKHKYGKKAHDLFNTYPNVRISKTQVEFIKSESNFDKLLSPSKLRSIIFFSFIVSIFFIPLSILQKIIRKNKT